MILKDSIRDLHPCRATEMTPLGSWVVETVPSCHTEKDWIVNALVVAE
jgi:hypothetical protein